MGILEKIADIEKEIRKGNIHSCGWSVTNHPYGWICIIQFRTRVKMMMIRYDTGVKLPFCFLKFGFKNWIKIWSQTQLYSCNLYVTIQVVLECSLIAARRKRTRPRNIIWAR